jgi:cytochrome c-type biogenesis protein CcmH
MVAMLAAATSAFAAAPSPAPPAGDALDARLKHLEMQLRCLVCQNQTLADSNADLAGDLRKEVRELALAGKSDDQIRAYLVARYGDFVLYDPPLQGNTWLLWLGPFALLAGGGVLWWAVLRKRARTQAAERPETDVEVAARARALLEREEDLPA